MTWQGGRTRATGELVTADNWNITHVNNPKWNHDQKYAGCFLTKTGTQATGLATAITWEAESYDPDGMHSTSTNPSRITIIRTGYYMVGIYATANSATSFYLAINGSLLWTFDGTHTAMSKVYYYPFTAGQYVELYANTASRTIGADTTIAFSPDYDGGI